MVRAGRAHSRRSGRRGWEGEPSSKRPTQTAAHTSKHSSALESHQPELASLAGVYSRCQSLCGGTKCCALIASRDVYLGTLARIIRIHLHDTIYNNIISRVRVNLPLSRRQIVYPPDSFVCAANNNSAPVNLRTFRCRLVYVHTRNNTSSRCCICHVDTTRWILLGIDVGLAVGIGCMHLWPRQ